jgi:hypothetical protein
MKACLCKLLQKINEKEGKLNAEALGYVLPGCHG